MGGSDGRVIMSRLVRMATRGCCNTHRGPNSGVLWVVPSQSSRAEYARCARQPQQAAAHTLPQRPRARVAASDHLTVPEAAHGFGRPRHCVHHACTSIAGLAEKEHGPGIRGRMHFRWRVHPARFAEILDRRHQLDRAGIAARFGLSLAALESMPAGAVGLMIARLLHADPAPSPDRPPPAARSEAGVDHASI